MAKDNPHRKVGLVTFEETVEIIGDGSAPNVILGDEYMNDFDLLKKNGVATASTSFSKPISETQ